MGIVNVTPDSFSDGGHFFDPAKAVDHALQLVDDGADIIDIGGESSRPGAEPVTLDEELRRVVPIIEQIASHTKAAISVDTYKADVARQALAAGADIVNDISGLTYDPDMARTLAEFDAACILMHIKGTPRDMQKKPQYTDVIREITGFLGHSISLAEKEGVDPQKIIIDPGIGFGKRHQDNIDIHRYLQDFAELNKPILFGSSRKSFLGCILDCPPEQRLEGTIASNVMAILNGAHIIRVHDVAVLKKAAQVADVLKIR